MKIENRTRDILIILFLFLIAILPRIIFLTKIPPGLHGDEAWTGIDARRIIKQGWIGAYTTSALGQPTGPLYITAFILRLFGENIFNLRLSMALFGILTIPMYYLFLRLFFNKKISFLTTLTLNFSLYHIHYSRIAFMLISAPLLQLVSLIYLIKARKQKKLSYYALTGFFTGIGLLTYNSFTIFPLLVIIPIFYDLLTNLTKRKKSTKFKPLIIFTISFIISSLPLSVYVLKNTTTYLQHFKTFSVLNKKEVKLTKNIYKKSLYVLDNGFHNLFNFFLGKKVDFADGFGQYRNFHPLYLLILSIGVIYALFNFKKYNLYFLISLLFSFSPSFLTFDGIYRRPILSIIYIFYFIALGYYVIIKFIQNAILKKITYIILIFIISIISISNLKIYFSKFSKSPITKWVFCTELVKASKTVKELADKNTKILFFSQRHSCRYETFSYLTNNFPCEDRSMEFGHYSINIIPDRKNLFVLLNKYISIFPQVKTLYPGGQTFYLIDNETQNILGIVYSVN